MTEFFEKLVEILKDPLNVISLSVSGLMIIFAFFAVETKKIVDSLISLSAVSLLSVLLFVVLKAPDVAITEAAVGSGIATAVMIFALWKIDSKADSDNQPDKKADKQLNKVGEK
ncbi:MAG TPA: sodium:proton antiporter [Fervidobacterium sp.]|nr:sodium:proton antiporter [Fervidobacterium sp.]